MPDDLIIDKTQLERECGCLRHCFIADWNRVSPNVCVFGIRRRLSSVDSSHRQSHVKMKTWWFHGGFMVGVVWESTSRERTHQDHTFTPGSYSLQPQSDLLAAQKLRCCLFLFPILVLSCQCKVSNPQPCFHASKHIVMASERLVAVLHFRRNSYELCCTLTLTAKHIKYQNSFGAAPVYPKSTPNVRFCSLSQTGLFSLAIDRSVRKKYTSEETDMTFVFRIHIAVSPAKRKLI